MIVFKKEHNEKHKGGSDEVKRRHILLIEFACVVIASLNIVIAKREDNSMKKDHIKLHRRLFP